MVRGHEGASRGGEGLGVCESASPAYAACVTEVEGAGFGVRQGRMYSSCLLSVLDGDVSLQLFSYYRSSPHGWHVCHSVCHCVGSPRARAIQESSFEVRPIMPHYAQKGLSAVDSITDSTTTTTSLVTPQPSQAQRRLASSSQLPLTALRPPLHLWFIVIIALHHHTLSLLPSNLQSVASLPSLFLAARTARSRAALPTSSLRNYMPYRNHLRPSP
jgi:hypothetical protein